MPKKTAKADPSANAPAATAGAAPGELPPPVRVLQMATGGWLAGAIATFAELSIADELGDGPKSVAHMAKRLSLHERSLYRLLRCLTLVGIVREHPEQTFELLETGQFLREGVEGSMRAAAIFFASHHAQRPWENAARSIRTGKPSFDEMYGMNAWDYYAKNPKDALVFQNAMTALAGTLHKAAIEAYDFSGINIVMDVGGGHGQLLAQILAKHPKMRGILFDLPHVISHATATFGKLRVADRATTAGGSFFEKVPLGADAHVLAHIIHDWDDEHSMKILRACRESIASGGRLLIIDAVLPGPNVPDFGKLLDLEMLLVPGGQERTAEEFEALLAKSGWKLSRIIPTSAGKSIIEGLPA